MSLPAEDPGEELVEIIDAVGRVERIVSRAEMRRDNLRHRCTYILVLTSSGRLVVHKRADWKDIAPGFWDLCFGGVVDVGEEWAEAARRELLEEAGIVPVDPLIDLGEVSFESDQTRLRGRVYLCISDQEPTCPDGEVVALDTVVLAQLPVWLEHHQVCADSKDVALPLLLDYGQPSP